MNLPKPITGGLSSGERKETKNFYQPVSNRPGEKSTHNYVICKSLGMNKIRIHEH